jgi:hypothetical protein
MLPHRCSRGAAFASLRPSTPSSGKCYRRVKRAQGTMIASLHDAVAILGSPERRSGKTIITVPT